MQGFKALMQDVGLKLKLDPREPRNKKGAPFGFKGLVREPKPEKKGNKGLLWVLDTLNPKH